MTAMLFFLFACTSTSGKAPEVATTSGLDTASADSSTKVKKITVTTGAVEKTDFEIDLCKTYDQFFAMAIRQHLTQPLDSMAAHKKKGLAMWISPYQKKHKDIFEQIRSLQVENYCDLFTQINRAIYALDSAKITDQDEEYTYEQYAVWSLNDLFSYSLQSLDYYSYVPVPKTIIEIPFKDTEHTSYIPLLNRIDYRWRKPSALIVDPSYTGMPYAMIPPLASITQLGSFNIKENAFDIAEMFLQIGAPEKKLAITFQPYDNSQKNQIEVDTYQSQKESLNSVRSHYIDDTILYIRVSEISEKSKDLIVSHLPSPERMQNLRGLIFDFTGNGGGRTEFAEKIASLFLPFGSPLFRTEQNIIHQGQKKLVTELRTHQFPSPFPNKNVINPAHLPPIIVLTSRGTASAAEVITAVWKSNKLPMLTLGEVTFGKAINVSMYPRNHLILQRYVTTKSIFAFDEKDDGSIGWYTWQLDEEKNQRGLEPDILLKDPVLEYLYQNPNARDFSGPAFTMRDHKDESPNVPVIEFSKPQTQLGAPVHVLFPKDYQLKQDEKIAMQDYAKTLQIDACDPDAIPGKPKFREADQCLYQAGIQVMRKWIQYRNP